MGRIRFFTQQFAPDEVVQLRRAPDWYPDVAGHHTDGAWTFELDDEDVEFRFVLVPGRLSAVVALTAAQVAAGWDTDQVQFGDAEELVTENSLVAQRFFPRDLDEEHVYDVIVVGSGTGGGVLASKLAREGADVLVCEAGSFLFPTHVGNLSRQLRIGQFDKHVWSLWDEFRVRNHETASPDVASAQAFNLGGRSIFWGGLIPRQEEWELAAWPAAVRDHLLQDGFAAAEKVLNRAVPDASPFQAQARTAIETLVPGFEAVDAPVAAQYNAPNPLLLPGGIFSTADLLLEDRLLVGTDRKPQVNLNTAVQRVVVENGAATGVRAFDLVERRAVRYRGEKVVLSAGTIESAKIALLSGIGNPRIGTGLTDHLIQFRHFALPPGTLDAGPMDSAKILLRHPGATADSHGFVIVVELGANLNQGRYVDREHLDREAAIRAGWTMCEIVFLYHGALRDQNTVTLQGDDPATRVRLVFDRVLPSPADLDEAARIARDLFGALGAQPIPGEEGLDLEWAGLGGVAHEVGTLRMGPAGVGVVDEDLRFHDVANLYACDNSVFPASPAANPSLTTVALALRLAGHLSA